MYSLWSGIRSYRRVKSKADKQGRWDVGLFLRDIVIGLSSAGDRGWWIQRDEVFVMVDPGGDDVAEAVEREPWIGPVD